MLQGREKEKTPRAADCNSFVPLGKGIRDKLRSVAEHIRPGEKEDESRRLEKRAYWPASILGVINPMVVTPTPFAMSITSATEEKLRLGSPLTNKTFSARME